MDMQGALEGVRVLDCTQIIAGPLAASLLSEMGADVIKVEPIEGEPWRLHAEIVPKESRAFIAQNRGKRDIAINFKHPEASAAREALIRWADVLITNYRPGVPEELHIDYESAKAIKPDIIYCENTAFGKEGPDSHRRGYDIVAQAMSGVITSSPNIRDDLPVIVAFAPADIVTGVSLAWAITAALFHKERTGEGQAINSSLLHTSLFLQAGARQLVAFDEENRLERLRLLAEARARGAPMAEIYEERRRLSPELAGNIYYRPYQTKDGYLVLGALGPGPRARFRAALGVHDPRYDEGFDASLDNVHAVSEQLMKQCEETFKTKTNEEWLEYLGEHDVACGPVRFVDELFEDPQVVANHYFADYEHPLLGTVRSPAPIVQMSQTPTRVNRPSPMLGEHSEEVLREVGLDAEEISRLFAADVVR